MSVAGIGSTSMTQYMASPAAQPTRRQQEDAIGRELEADLKNGDLQGAQQAWQQLAAFGPNNSGPFNDPTLKQDFQSLGADLASGNLAGAQSDNASLTAGLMHNDVQAVARDFKGNSANLGNAIANLKGDYWAIFGQQFNMSQLAGFLSTNTGGAGVSDTTGGSGVSTTTGGVGVSVQA